MAATSLFCNLVGGQDELVFDGHSLVFDPEGELVARGRQFEEDLLCVDLHPEEALIQRLHDPRLRKDDAELHPQFVEIPAAGVGETGDSGEPRVEPELSEEGEVLEALTLGLKDYFGKNGFSRAVLGLSGGIDSSLGAAVAARALGPENVTGVLLPSRYTSEASNTDAEALAKNLGIDVQVVPIGPAFDAYLEMLEEALQGPAGERGRGEPAGPHPGQHPHGAIEQVRLDRALHRQQERDERRLLHALR